MSNSVLRFLTAGSVDDGKSTLIGRLLYDSHTLLTDQLQSLEKGSRHGLDLSLLTDGLLAEREQGITIDVAYRYFATAKRKFIIADTPGHEQYTRNMMTGASTAQAILLIIDAAKFVAAQGLLVQTKRHAMIAKLLNVQHVVVVVNKMDLVDCDENAFGRIVREFQSFAQKIELKNFQAIPTIALNGDNVVEPSSRMPWYQGRPLLQTLEGLPIETTTQSKPFRFPVQLVTRVPVGAHQKRGYMGRVESGQIQVGQKLMILPSRQVGTVEKITVAEEAFASTLPGQSVTLFLEEQVDVSRGDLLCAGEPTPKTVKTFSADVCWLSEDPLNLNHRYWIKHTTKQAKCKVEEITSVLDVQTLDEVKATTLRMNDIARVRVSVQTELAVDDFAFISATGSFILIDEITHQTAAAGMIRLAEQD